MLLLKSDHARRIDQIIDYFGGVRRRRPARAGPTLAELLMRACPSPPLGDRWRRALDAKTTAAGGEALPEGE
jgi:hypothetical protein